MKNNIYPPMHTAEHLLNQTMIRLFGIKRCFSAHIEKKKSKCDYIYEQELNEDDIKRIELTINTIIKNNIPITSEFIPRAEAEKIYALKNMPPEIDEIKIIKIGDFDATPCIGQHVISTKELGIFKIISSSQENNILRIRFKLNNT